MINGLRMFGLYLAMLAKVFSRPENKKVYLKRIVDEMVNLGFNSLGIVSIISFFMGAVVTIQTGLQLSNPFIPKFLVGYATRESLILEFSPTMIALILAGKVGSSIASEIGTMRVSEQIDALEIMGINSSSFIIQPKIIASVLFFPFLVIISMAIGMVGGYLAATLGGIISKGEFLQGLLYWFEPFYIFYALIKTVFFAFAISSVSSFFGYYTKGGAIAVGKSSTKAVVYSCVVVLIINFLITQLMLS
ncbi:MAG: ABC transporter permease [Bacteroidota bacterium]|nr:ABC transporter permease [Bacteroidota bacterium]